ncbi:hypothetical protein [Nitrosomonas sp. HPC101]|uniref:hypothetical protein n=1 Tax=Nitrosomonas sp. HPC101 TaxID=1658667 RepID=UPI001368DC64|nr:hypothetical protein [Nitrosomonas sp. HPC101]
MLNSVFSICLFAYPHKTKELARLSEANGFARCLSSCTECWASFNDLAQQSFLISGERFHDWIQIKRLLQAGERTVTGGYWLATLKPNDKRKKLSSVPDRALSRPVTGRHNLLMTMAGIVP